MRQLRKAARLLLRGVLCVILIQRTASLCAADPRTKQQLKNQMPAYNNAAQSRANSLNGLVSANISAWRSGQDPKWYGGNGSLAAGSFEILQAFFEDFLANLGISHFPSRFLDCFNLDFGGICTRRGPFGIRIPIGLNMTYRVPIQQIHSRRFFQNRYLPEEYYDLLRTSGYYENIWNPAADALHAPTTLLRASVETAFRLNTKSWAAYIPAHGVIVPKVNISAANAPLNSPQERGRYDGGTVSFTNEDLTQLEYSMGPTLMHVAWSVLAQYFPVLQVLPCAPPAKIPPPFGSEDPAMVHITRDPFLGFIFSRDTELRQDLTDWLKNPNVCQEWMLNRNRQNIPFDMMKPNPSGSAQFAIFNPLSFAISLVPNSDGLTPLPDSQLSRFDRMCTRNWGGSIPFTTTHQVHDSPFIAAGKNFEKAIRLGVAIDKTYLSQSGARNYVAYYPLDKGRDAYQMTYPDQWDCKGVGDPGKPFAGANGFQAPTEYGLYSMTHWWTIPNCCVRFANILNVAGSIGSFGVGGIPSGILDPQTIFSRVNPPNLPQINQVITIPNTTNIPNTGIPNMPTQNQNPNTQFPNIPSMPGLPF